MFSIGEFGRLGGVTPRTLRYYEELGLLVPAVVDPSTGYRRYGGPQLLRLHRIVALKDLGLSLAQVAALVDDLGPEQLRGMLLLKRTELAARLVEDRDRLARVERALRRLEGAPVEHLDVVLKSVPALRVATLVHHQVIAGFDDPDADAGEMPEAVARLFAALSAGAVRPLGPLFFFYDEEPGGGLLPHTAVEIGDQPLPVDGPLVDRELPAVDVVSAVYRGVPDHADVGPIYVHLGQWAADHGYRSRGPGRDLVLDGGTGQPGDPVVLELQLPVEPA
jgi:DNA-binding transcriptional MerR regulator